MEDALVLSPSSGGLQPWTFIVVDDPVIREKLVPVSFGQTKVKEASHLVVFAAKQNFNEADVDAHLQRTAADVRGSLSNHWLRFAKCSSEGSERRWIQLRSGSPPDRQVAIALGNLLTSAALLGIDACPMEGFVPEQYNSILGLAERGLSAVAICTLGYRSTSDAYAALLKVRFPKADVLIHI